MEDGYEFFAKRQLVTLFSAPNYCGEFDNAGGMMSVDETLMCSFQVTTQAGKYISRLVRYESRIWSMYILIQLKNWFYFSKFLFGIYIFLCYRGISETSFRF